jgi:hypothetical protein
MRRSRTGEDNKYLVSLRLHFYNGYTEITKGGGKKTRREKVGGRGGARPYAATGTENSEEQL